MNSNVLALDPARTLHNGGKPDRAEVEAAVRGVHKPDTDLVTSRMLGCFRDNPHLRQEFFAATD
jgi:hypothetical protein